MHMLYSVEWCGKVISCGVYVRLVSNVSADFSVKLQKRRVKHVLVIPVIILHKN